MTPEQITAIAELNASLKVAYDEVACANEGAQFYSRKVAELERENGRLKNEIHEWEESDAAASVLGPVFSEEIARLSAALKLAREDTARLDWIFGNGDGPSPEQLAEILRTTNNTDEARAVIDATRSEKCE